MFIAMYYEADGQKEQKEFIVKNKYKKLPGLGDKGIVSKDKIERLAEMVFPPKCIFCGSILAPGGRLHICPDCYAKVEFAHSPVLLAERGQHTGCDFAVCVCNYSGVVKDSLIKFKFFNKPGYFRTFARLLSDRLGEILEPDCIDIITSVPLYKKRQRERGYNQAALLAGRLGSEMGLPVEARLLSRIRNTGVQSLLKGNDRISNVRDAFTIRKGARLSGKSVLLVDDVLTTGSTIDECSRILKEAGAARVIGAVIASGRSH